MQDILFGYRVKPTNNFLGTDGSGNAVSIYGDGLVQYHHFVYDSDAPVSSVEVRKGSVIAEEIQEVLAKYEKDIECIPVEVYNETLDGAWCIFTFYDKTITIDNPHRYPKRTDEEELAYYNDTLLDILDEVSTILTRHGLPLLRRE